MLPSESDVDSFLDSVGEVTRLIDGLKAGTIPPEWVDKRIAERDERQAKKSSSKSKELAAAAAAASARRGAGAAGGDTSAAAPDDDDAAAAAKAQADEAARQAELQRKLEELKASRARKQRARQLYGSYVEGKQQAHACGGGGVGGGGGGSQHTFATDYTQWDLWCPSDEEDDLVNSTPNTPEFRAMERDIDKRHARMVEQRQLAERQRQAGNAAYAGRQYSEALRCYEAGLEAQRTNMALHANAALAALKIRCFGQALEHCDKVLHLAEVLHGCPQHPLCVKALQRRAAAHQGLAQHSRAVADLEAAGLMVPDDAELAVQLTRARALLQEHRTARQLAKLVAPAEAPQPPAAAGTTQSGEGGPADAAATPSQQQAPGAREQSSCKDASSTDTPAASSLQRIRELVQQLAAAGAPGGDAGAASSTCTQLLGLVLQGGSSAAAGLFFRECGGLAAVAKLVSSSSSDTAGLAACLRLLAAVCEADTALEQLATHHQHVLHDALRLCCASDEALATAATELAYAASTSAACRPALCRQLLLHAAHPLAAAPCTSISGRSCLGAIWGACCCATPDAHTRSHAAARHALLVSLLSNCLLVPAVRSALLGLLQQTDEAAASSLAALGGQLCLGERGGAARMLLATKVCGLISNAALCPRLRGLVAACEPVVQQLLHTAASAHLQDSTSMQTAGQHEHVAAALGSLCNLSAEPGVQQQLADSKAVGTLLQMAGSAGGCCAASESECVLLLAERATTLLSRAAKQPAGLQALRQQGAQPALVRSLAAALDHAAGASAASGAKDSAAASCWSRVRGWAAAIMRCLALTADSTGGASTADDAAAPTIALCCRLLTGHLVDDDALRGNAALVLSHYAGGAGGGGSDGSSSGGSNGGVLLSLLVEADAVGALLAAARAGKGGGASRNAGIALSRLALAEPRCLDRLRELRGLEVILEYVRQP